MKKHLLYLILLIFQGCTLLNEPDQSNYNTEKLLNETIALIKNKYPFITFKKINVDSLQSLYTKKLPEYKGDDVYRLLYDLLHELKDGHVSFKNSSNLNTATYIPPRSLKDRELYDPNVVRNYFDKELNRAAGNKIEYGILEENIGYIYIATMLTEGNSTWSYAIEPIISELNNTKGLILDVRGNGGGSDYITSIIISHFISEPMLGPLWLNADGSPLIRGQFYPAKTTYTNKPVVVLQNGVCFSATEGFISTMRELPNVTIMGDTTGGGSAAPRDFPISEGFTIHLSTLAQFTYDGKFIEWNGIEPDILVVQSKEELDKGRDIQLEEAIKFLMEE